MTAAASACPPEPGVWADYLLGELPRAEEERLEEHLFECAACAGRLESVHRIGIAVAEAVRGAAVGASVNRAFLERAGRDGLALREYRISAGETVPCSAGPEDLVVVRLAADFAELAEPRLEIVLHDLESGQTAPPMEREAVVDRELGELVLVFPGEVVRAFPRSRWDLTVHGDSPSGPRVLGPFVMDHTP